MASFTSLDLVEGGFEDDTCIEKALDKAHVVSAKRRNNAAVHGVGGIFAKGVRSFVLYMYVMVSLTTLQMEDMSAMAFAASYCMGQKPFNTSFMAAPVAALPFMSESDLGTAQTPFRRKLSFWTSDYVTWHTRNRYSSKRRVVFQSPHSGLGDRYRGLLRVWLLAVLSQRIFLIDWSTPFPFSDAISSTPGTNFIFNEQLDTPPQIQRATRYGNRTMSDSASFVERNVSGWRAFEHALASDVHTIFLQSGEPAELSSAQIKKCSYNQTSPFPLMSKSENWSVLRAIMRHVFRPSKKLSSMHKAANKVFDVHPISELPAVYNWYFYKYLPRPLKNRLSSSTPYISVHARIGKGVGEAHHKRFVAVSENMQKMADCLAVRSLQLVSLVSKESPSGSQNASIFLATDTPDFRALFVAAVHNLSRTATVLSGKWDTAHFNHLKRNNSTKHERALYLSSYLDLLLLGHGEHMISTGSGYAQLAFWLGAAQTFTAISGQECGVF